MPHGEPEVRARREGTHSACAARPPKAQLPPPAHVDRRASHPGLVLRLVTVVAFGASQRALSTTAPLAMSQVVALSAEIARAGRACRSRGVTIVVDFEHPGGLHFLHCLPSAVRSEVYQNAAPAATPATPLPCQRPSRRRS